MQKDDAYWRAKLTDEQYQVLREKGTEAPFSGQLLKTKDEGVYRCAACGEALFSSSSKYDSGSGWPSFNDAMSNTKLKLSDDFSHHMHRIEVSCANCGSHLGHLFDDESQPTGKYYCINSCALDFNKSAKSEKKS